MKPAPKPVTKTARDVLDRLTGHYADEAFAARPLTAKALAAVLRRHGEPVTPQVLGDWRVALLRERMRLAAAEGRDRR